MQGNFMLLFLVFFPFAAALVGYGIGRRSKKLRDRFAALCGLVELVAMATCAATTVGQTLTFSWNGFCALGINLVVDDFRRIWGLVAAFMWAMTLLFSGEYFQHYRNRNRYYFFNLLTLGATVGVFLSADLYTTFLFFEVMSFTSYAWVAHEETSGALRAADTYLAVAVIGGLVALMGLFLLQHELGTLAIDALYDAARACENKAVLYVAGGCLLFGFGAKAGLFPLHIWLPKAHPVAPAPASALLSGILTKSGVFGILAVSCNVFRYDPAWGRAVLLLGVITMLLGAVLALCSLDLKRTLACSSLSQIGFIAVGIGMMGILGPENALAARGVVLHMVNHSLFKLVLFMAAGVVFMNLHQLNLNDIRGFGRRKPLLNLCFLSGALGISGIPLFSGYVSKTLLHESIVEGVAHLAALGQNTVWLQATEWIFLLSGGLTLAYMTKLYVVLFVEQHPTRQAEFDAIRRYMNGRSAVALALPALLLPLLGMTPTRSMDWLADHASGFLEAELPAHAVHYFSLVNLKGAGISIAIGAVVYLLVVRELLLRRREGVWVYLSPWPDWLDLEELLYRPLLLKWLPGVFGWIGALFGENRLLAPLGRKLLFSGGVELRTLSHPEEARPEALRAEAIRKEEELAQDPARQSLSYRLGAWLDRRFPPAEGKRSRAERFASVRQTVRETTMLITGNLSFALLMCSFGLCLLLLYLVFLY